VAVLARGVSRAGEVLARYGGEEFAVILPNADSAAACAAAERLRASIERAAIPHPSSRTAPFVTASIGVATAPAGDGTPESLLGSADAALYAAKALGRNRVAAADARVAYCQEPSEKPMP
jgi:diguanylate cyclase (GGDEF)-like protein